MVIDAHAREKLHGNAPRRNQCILDNTSGPQHYRSHMAQSLNTSPRPVAFITGASSGIGAAASSVFAAAGYDVVLAARRLERLERAAAEARAACPAARVVPVVCDVTSDLAVRNAFRTMEEQFGRLDVLINNAGFGVYGSVAQTPLASFRASMETNFFGALRCTQAALPLLRRAAQNPLALPPPSSRGGAETPGHSRGAKRARWPGACIVMVSSIVGRRAFPLASAYCAGKFALEGLSEALRVELYDQGIAVSVVNPGVVRSEFFDAAQGTRPAGFIPAQQGMSPADVAQALLQAARRPCRNRYLTWAGKGGIALQWLAPEVFDYLLIRAQRTSEVKSEK